MLDPAEYDEQVRFAADIRVHGARPAEGRARRPTRCSPGSPRSRRLVLRQGRRPATWPRRAGRRAKRRWPASGSAPCPPSARPGAGAETSTPRPAPSATGPTGDGDTARAKTLDPRARPLQGARPAGRPLALPRLQRAHLRRAGHGHGQLRHAAPQPTGGAWPSTCSASGHEGRTGAGAGGHDPGRPRLPHGPRGARGAPRQEAHPAPERGLVHARREAAFTEPPTGVGVDRTRSMLRQAVAAYAAGRSGDADRLVIDAYLQGFEPLEPRLRARDAEGTREVEAGFRDLRAAMARGDAADRVRAQASVPSRARIGRLAGEKATVVPFLAAFVIYLREGIEAALLVGALLAGPPQARPARRGALHPRWGGCWPCPRASAPSSSSTARSAWGPTSASWWRRWSPSGRRRARSRVSFWLISKAESRHWMAYLKERLEAGLSRRSLYVLSGLAFLAVYREAAETVLFTQALLLDAEGARSQVYLGAAGGPPGRGPRRLRDEPHRRCACPSGPSSRSPASLLCAPRRVVRGRGHLRAGRGRLPAPAARALPGGAVDGHPPRPDRPRSCSSRSCWWSAWAPGVLSACVRAADAGDAPERHRDGSRTRRLPAPARARAAGQARLPPVPRDARRSCCPCCVRAGLGLVERDVRDDPEMERRYLLEIPVLLFGEVELARHRVRPLEALASRLRELGLGSLDASCPVRKVNDDALAGAPGQCGTRWRRP